MNTSTVTLAGMLCTAAVVAVAADQIAVVDRTDLLLKDDGTWALMQDKRVTAKNGEKAVLHPDGTWEAYVAGGGGGLRNLSLGKPARQNSTYGNYDYCQAGAAVDGNTNGDFNAGSVRR